MEGGGRDVLEVVRILDREGLFPETFMVREPTLDDVFLSLTGHKAVQVSNGDGDREPAGARGRGGAA